MTERRVDMAVMVTESARSALKMEHHLKYCVQRMKSSELFSK